MSASRLDAPSAAATAAVDAPLDRRLAETLRATDEQGRVIAPLCDRFLAESSPAAALALWLREGHRAGGALGKAQIRRLLSRDIAQLDALLTEQTNAVLHHPAFQRLEGSWTGLRYLVDQIQDPAQVKVRVISLSWQELSRDIDRAIEFDQSQIFRKIYSAEFDTPGGEPYGLLVGDYYLDHHPAEVATLGGMAQVAAAAFAPFVAGADPAVFGLDEFAQLERPLNLSRTFEQTEYLKWRGLREAEDTRFVGLTLPRVLMRRPRQGDGSRVDGFQYDEGGELPSRSDYVWGNSAYALAAVVLRAFQETGWLADIRGVRHLESGGLVNGLPIHSFATDAEGVAPRSVAEVQIPESQEKELADLGFIPLCHCHDTDLAVFYSNQSLQKPPTFDEASATANARLSAMLQYLLCVSRFAHYVKVLTRDKLGAFTEAAELEQFLHKWLQRYVTPDMNASEQVRCERPLRQATVQIREKPGRPGAYVCVVKLSPHYQLDELVGGLRLVTELNPGQRAS